ncbi:MAG: anti-sigma factor [Rhodothermaceae bacterium]|nr:MAG: anti-sigma factor [Rhodothermaceae bacterium]
MKRERNIPPLPEAVAARLEELSEAERASLRETWVLCETARPEVAPDPARKAAARASLLAEAERTTAARRLPSWRPFASRLRLLHRPGFLRPVAVAASVMLLVAVAFLLREPRPTIYQAPYGERLALQLPDGSSVELNSGSTLRLAPDFGPAGRHVVLEGEAFFDVTSHKAAFVVETFDAVTEVLGTRFNVRARPADPMAATRVAVEEGRVRLASKKVPSAARVLTAGETASLTPEGVPTAPDTGSVAHMLAWRSGALAFQNQPLGLIFDELERRFDLDIAAAEELRLRPQSYFKHPPFDVETVLAELTQMTDLRYRPTANGYEVYRP